MSYILANQPVVIDNGSGFIKAGIAGETLPKCYFSNIVGRPKYHRVMAGGLEGDLFIGKKAQDYRGLLKLEYPMEHGIVTNWTDMEHVWQHLYSPDCLNINSEEHPVLLSEAPLNPTINREKMAEIFFETFNAPALHIQVQAVLSLYSTGRTTGVVLDCGDGVTHIVPIYNGFALSHAIQRTEIAGRDVTKYLKKLLFREGIVLARSSEFEIVREIKEKACYVSMNVTKEDSNIGDSNKKSDYILPDNSQISLGACRYKAPEILFNSSAVGQESKGVHEYLVDSILSSDTDLRKDLYANVILSGGTTFFSGFGDRLLSEVKKSAAKDAKWRISAPQERINSAWIGGSIVASLDTFRKIWISKKEYEDEGAKIVHRKTY
uniref:Beta-centractin (inferred by orthology to a human protein) n=1 Tax=Strongyloides venezuelensis TaxID=75913 RepID=A0A0K0F1H4_STRVS